MKDQNSFDQVTQALKFQEAQAQNNLRSAKDKYALQKQNIELAQTIYDNAITKEEIGKGNSIIVTQKYNQLMMAQAQYLGAMVDLFQAQLTLDKLYNKILSNQ
jgi:outer membrane protein TolC